MCGLCGIIGFNSNRAVLQNMLSFLKHRGPDNSDFWESEAASLGHARLSIVDLSPRANQPIANEDGSIRMVGNGEIYNFKEIRKDLERAEHCFISESDNEVLLHLYEEYDLHFVDRINGMFAVAIWDSRRQRLILARDRLGIKPIYYYMDASGIAFASEIKALLTCPFVHSGINPTGLKQYLKYENTFGPVTLHKDIWMVEPGQIISWQNGKAKFYRYWVPKIREDSRLSFSNAVEQYYHALARSVKRHLMSDVEVASYLSSGFDSSSVATIANGFSEKPILTFTGTFDSKGWYDETIGASSVSKWIGSRHHEVTITAKDFKKHFDDLLYALDEPRMGIGSFPQFMVAKSASEHVKVILTGHGGDEFFGGYPVFKLIHFIRLIQQRPIHFLKALLRVQPAELPHLVYFLFNFNNPKSLRSFLPVLFSEARLKNGLQPEVYRELTDVDPDAEMKLIHENHPDPYHQLILVYLRSYLPGLFVVEDKISMAHSLESRTPLCDNELIELALLCPLSLKLANNQLKAIPKSAMKSLLPKMLYRMPKRGFPTPLAHWLRGELKQWVCERLLGPDSSIDLIFRKDFIADTLNQYLYSWKSRFRPLDEIATHRIWMLLCLEGWLRGSRN